MMITRERLLFAVHTGLVNGRRAGIIMEGHSLPLACSHSSEDAPDGIMACWESTVDVEMFFHEGLGLSDGIEVPYGSHPGNRPQGLYVYGVEYTEADVEEGEDAPEDEWPWLHGGELRRPTMEKLEPLAWGRAPWSGRVL